MSKVFVSIGLSLDGYLAPQFLYSEFSIVIPSGAM